MYIRANPSSGSATPGRKILIHYSDYYCYELMTLPAPHCADRATAAACMPKRCERARGRDRRTETEVPTEGRLRTEGRASERAIPPHFLRRPIRAPAAAPAHLFSTLPSFFLPRPLSPLVRPFPPFLQSFPKSIHYGGHNNSRWRQARRSHGRFPPLPCLHAPHGPHSNYRQKQTVDTIISEIIGAETKDIVHNKHRMCG